MRTSLGYRAAVLSSLRADTFASREDAEAKLPAYRRALITKLRRAARADGLRLDATPESLAAVESWSFQIRRENDFDRTGLSPGELTEALYFYAGAVCVRHTRAKWIINRDDLDPQRYSNALKLGRQMTISYFERIPEASTSFWDDRAPRDNPSKLRHLFESVRDDQSPEDHPLVKPFARRLARGHRRVL